MPFHAAVARIGFSSPTGSRSPITDTSVVSLNSPMKVLTMPGIETFSACGRMISRVDFQ